MADLELTFRTLGAPVQIDGVLGDKEVYYRDRHGSWRVDIDGETIVSGSSGLHDPMGEHVKRIVDAVWHPYLSDAYNAREDEVDEVARKSLYYPRA